MKFKFLVQLYHLRFATFIWMENHHFVATVFVVSCCDTISINEMTILNNIDQMQKSKCFQYIINIWYHG